MPTDPSLKPMADIFARGKGDDNLPLYTLEETGTLLVETILEAGDVLFVPAGFPHVSSLRFPSSNTLSERLSHQFYHARRTHRPQGQYLMLQRRTIRAYI